MDVVAKPVKVIPQEPLKVFLTGYAHIDSEWLWSLKETAEVCRNTFWRVLELMERSKDLVFEQGAVLNYELVERTDPKLMKLIIKRIREGRWRISGAPFLEFDAYMPSGESLVRHLLYGRRYFEEHGATIEPVLFLPDSFGFPISLSKILKGFGIRYFVTYKLNWNDTNSFRYNIFYWGENRESAVLTYILPGNYNDYLSDVKRLFWNVYKQFVRQKIPIILVVYGRGDHGGGPEEKEVRNIEDWRKRLHGVMELVPSGMEDFFNHVEKAYGKVLPIIRDELYLEFHRGVYTTGATIKKLNRINENLVLQVEKLFTLLNTAYGIDYPYNTIKKCWKNILLGQGHDSLPSTLTSEVYKEVVERGFKTFKLLLETLKIGLEKISEKTGMKYVVFNPNAWSTSIYIRTWNEIDGFHQVLNNGEKLYYLKDLPPLGFRAFNFIESVHRDIAEVHEEKEQYLLENRYLRVTISKRNGWITSIFDKINKREILKGPIRLRVLWDIPAPFRFSAAPASIFDAWEVYYNEWINKYFYKDLKAYRHRVGERGPLYASVKLNYKYRQVTSGLTLLELEVGLYADKPYLEIVFRGVWRARHRFLKLLIPIRIDAKEAFFEAPYGVIVRRDACLSRNPLDRAKFEIPGHRWVDVFKDDYGVAIITDSRYGYSWCNGVIGVSMLRAPLPPDKDFIMKFIEGVRDVQEKFIDVSMELLDRFRRMSISLAMWLNAMHTEMSKLRKLKPVDHGYHTAKIYIYPHRGDYIKGGVTKRATELNTLYVIHASHRKEEGNGIEDYSFFEIEDSDSIELTVVKPSESGDYTVIRLFNTSPTEVRTTIISNMEISAVLEADLAEIPLRSIDHERHKIKVKLKPQEIKTFLIKFNK